MTGIKIEDVAFVRFRVPDLGAMKSFLDDFGLEIAAEDNSRVFARGTGTNPFLHVSEIGEPGFTALGLRAASLADLEVLAQSEDRPITALDAPGGGFVLTLTDPDGHQIEVVAGQTPASALPLPEHPATNTIVSHGRKRAPKRIKAGPAHVARLGHCVLNVSDFRASERWYKARFGFITSDEIALAPEFSIGAFLRCDLGERPTDHHTLFLIQSPNGPGFNHAAFEVTDLDDLMAGHERLKASGRTAEWGVGRHILGSQIFDYWRDPWGHTLEHWTDGDLFTAQDGSNTASLQDLLGVQWGPTPPASMG